MKLSSVRSLKTELLSGVSAVATDLGASTPFMAFSTRRATAQRTMDGIALGVTIGKKKDYRLAVRLQHTGPLVSAMTEEIRKQAKGEIDVKEIGSIVKFQGPTTAAFYRKRRRPLRIGSSIGIVPPPGFIAAGTLGCFVVRRSSPFYIGILTNNHVIADENNNPLNSPIAQPGTLDGGSFPADEVALLGKVVKLKTTGSNFVDAAVGDILEDIDFDPRTIGNLGDLQGHASVFELPANATVHKVGRTTGQTKGKVTAFDIDNVQVQYDLGVLRFDNQIEIEGTGTKAFSDGGDSGSLIVDDQLRAVGLLFAGGDVGGSNGKGLTYANPIETVLDALKVDLEL
jgi:hypothetical protein